MATKIQKLYKKSIDERADFLRRWDACVRYTLPRRDDENALLFDATAGDSVELLAANLFSLLTPPESGWLNIVREPDALGINPEVDMNVILSEQMLRANLNDSNFYTTVHQAYLDMVILGTACIYMSENPIGADSAFSFTAINMNNISMLRNSSDEIIAVFHNNPMSLPDILEKYPSWTPPSEYTEKSEPILEVIQSVIKSDNGFDFVAWVNCVGEFENNILGTGHFDTNPFIIFRWSALSGETYGRSPVMRALPDIKTANKVVELVLKNATIAVSGIWQADDDGVINLSNINLTPGAIIPKAVGSMGLTPLTSGANFDVSQLVLNDLRTRIRGALLTDKLMAMTDKEMTATEVIARNAEMLRVLGATYGRLLCEFIRPMVARGLQILARRGVICPLCLRKDAELKYIAPISSPINIDND